MAPPLTRRMFARPSFADRSFSKMRSAALPASTDLSMHVCMYGRADLGNRTNLLVGLCIWLQCIDALQMRACARIQTFHCRKVMMTNGTLNNLAAALHGRVTGGTALGARFCGASSRDASCGIGRSFHRCKVGSATRPRVNCTDEGRIDFALSPQCMECEQPMLEVVKSSRLMPRSDLSQSGCCPASVALHPHHTQTCTGESCSGD